MTETTPLRLALLDVDGTLVDSQGLIVAAMEAACRASGVMPPAAEVVRGGIGLTLLDAVVRALPEVEPTVQERIAEAYKQAFWDLRAAGTHAEVLFPGAVEALDALEAAGVLLGLATGKSRRGIASFIERNGLDGRFTTLHSADDGPGKPHPAMILAALDNTGCRPDHVVMVGDTTFDMDMARAAGVGAIGVSWGNHPPAALREAGAHKVLDDFGGLRQAVDLLTNGDGICDSGLS
jgi:phosphoglycolate phosphatase